MNESYQPSESDRKLAALGFNLLNEDREAVRLAGFGPGAAVLDVATGSGRMLMALVEAGCRVVSGDISEDVMRQTRERLGAVADRVAGFRVLDAARMDLADDSIDNIATANSMHHMQEPRRVLDEMTRVLKPQGRLLLVEFNANGFDVIGRVHREVHGGDHDRGGIAVGQIEDFLRAHFASVERHDLPLNHVWIAALRRMPPGAAPE